MSLEWQTKLFLDHEELYDGSQLRPGYLAQRFHLWGNAQVIFRGPACVPSDHLVDQMDAQAGAVIKSQEMLHFLAQWYHLPWEVGPLCLYLNAHFLKDYLRLQGIEASVTGNDVYVSGRKLNVSISTAGDGVVLIHVGVNVKLRPTDFEGGVGLTDLGIEPQAMAGAWAQFWDGLIRRWMRDLYKVRWVNSARG